MGFLYQIDTSHKGINESSVEVLRRKIFLSFPLTCHVITSEPRSGKSARDDELTHVMLCTWLSGEMTVLVLYKYFS